jgi:hypothetical protein
MKHCRSGHPRSWPGQIPEPGITALRRRPARARLGTAQSVTPLWFVVFLVVPLSTRLISTALPHCSWRLRKPQTSRT